jgi:hypothetical protein
MELTHVTGTRRRAVLLNVPKAIVMARGETVPS